MKRMFVTVLGLALLFGPTTGHAVARPLAIRATKAVSIVDFAFMPKTARIAHGTMVKWTNNGATTHTTTSNTGLWNKSLAPGRSFTRTFNQVGTFKYHCSIHPSMTGSIIVS